MKSMRPWFTLINCKQSLSYSDVLVALVNYKVRRKDTKSSFNSTSAEALTARGVGSNHKKDKRDFGKSKFDGHEELKKNQCAFCKEEGC